MMFLGLTLGLVLVLGWLWLLVPAWYGTPFVPTRPERIRAALRLAQLKPGETLYDLGAGDGRVLLLAVKEFGAQAVGIEVGPLQWARGRGNLWFNGIRRGVRLERGDFWQADLSAADVVFVYLTAAQMPRLQKKLAAELRPGARVVTVAADLPGWQPMALDERYLLFLYVMPPQHGDWVSLL
ncbi:MAG: SAM-dependent methyltransferase [Anaerolineae bacterium]